MLAPAPLPLQVHILLVFLPEPTRHYSKNYQTERFPTVCQNSVAVHPPPPVTAVDLSDFICSLCQRPCHPEIDLTPWTLVSRKNSTIDQVDTLSFECQSLRLGSGRKSKSCRIHYNHGAIPCCPSIQTSKSFCEVYWSHFGRIARSDIRLLTSRSGGTQIIPKAPIRFPTTFQSF